MKWPRFYSDPWRKEKVIATEVLMPRLTDTMYQGKITNWFKKEGEGIQEGEPLFAVETDKASVEVNASVTGVLLKILVGDGQSAEVGERIAIIGESGEDIRSLIDGGKPREKEDKGFVAPARRPLPARVIASPAAKRKAKSENVDLREITGTAEGGLITEKDVAEYLAKKRTFSGVLKRYGPEERIPLEGIRRSMAERMASSAAIPQVTTVAETDVSDLVELSRETSITITSFVVRAVVQRLAAYPLMNASLDGPEVVIKRYFNIGVSVATPRGLIVPVIHNAEGKDIHRLSDELAGLAEKARENRLSLDDISGGTFTVTNSGVFGSLFFTPRINPPESAILGMGKIMKQPVVRDDTIALRSMMFLCLSYDHRIIDGEQAVKFLQEVKKNLESPRVLFMKG